MPNTSQLFILIWKERLLEVLEQKGLEAEMLLHNNIFLPFNTDVHIHASYSGSLAKFLHRGTAHSSWSCPSPHQHPRTGTA